MDRPVEPKEKLKAEKVLKAKLAEGPLSAKDEKEGLADPRKGKVTRRSGKGFSEIFVVQK